MSERTGTGDLSRLEPIEAAWLDPKEVSQMIGCSPQHLREQAQRNPAALGFPVCVIGTRVRIPRDGFLFWLSYGSPKV